MSTSKLGEKENTQFKLLFSNNLPVASSVQEFVNSKKGHQIKISEAFFSQTQTEFYFFMFYIYIYLCSQPYCTTTRIIIEENFLLLRTEKDSKINL